MINLISNKELALRWSEFEPQVNKAIAHGIGEATAHDLFVECMTCNAQFWELDKGVGITRFISFPQHKSLQIVTLTGRGVIKHLETYHKVIDQFAKETGCHNVLVYGRDKWDKVLPTGYKKAYSVFSKEL